MTGSISVALWSRMVRKQHQKSTHTIPSTEYVKKVVDAKKLTL